MISWNSATPSHSPPRNCTWKGLKPHGRLGFEILRTQGDTHLQAKFENASFPRQSVKMSRALQRCNYSLPPILSKRFFSFNILLLISEWLLLAISFIDKNSVHFISS